MGRTTKHKTRSNDTPPPSVFAEMPTISLLEAVVTKDPRWHWPTWWLEAAWDASKDESVRELAEFVREHRTTLVDEIAGHVRQVIAKPGGTDADDAVMVDSE